MNFNELLQIFFRTILGFFLLVVSMKIMGKREIGELSLFDLLIILSIADIMIIGIEHYNESILFFLIPLTVLVFLQKIISLIDLKFPKIRNILEGKEELIIYQGKIIIENMVKEKYNMNDLYTQLRIKDIRSIEEVEYAVLETNGNLSVFKYGQTKTFPIPVIISGVINEDVLKYTKHSKSWIYQQLKKQQITNIKEIFSGSIENDHLIITKTI